MKKLVLTAVAAILFAGAAAAHPTDVPYETRGECEAAYAEASKFDRERLIDLGIFETRGAALGRSIRAQKHDRQYRG